MALGIPPERVLSLLTLLEQRAWPGPSREGATGQAKGYLAFS